MLRHTGSMQTAKTGYIIMSALLVLIGALVVLFPGISVMTIGIACGVILILFGIVKMIGYFSRDLYRLAFQYDLAFGLLLTILGILILVRPERVMSLVSILLGIVILADGLFKIQIALDSRQFGLEKWWLILALALLAGVVGVLLVFSPLESANVLTALLGFAIMAEGILNLSTVLCAVKIVRNQHKDEAYEDYRNVDGDVLDR